MTNTTNENLNEIQNSINLVKNENNNKISLLESVKTQITTETKTDINNIVTQKDGKDYLNSSINNTLKTLLNECPTFFNTLKTQNSNQKINITVIHKILVNVLNNYKF